ncbi:MAG: SRPBCC domain-containing protein [Acidobacteria bacterium]|nr:SRPBCC domain-containing protein [Acidobacteriota bacterium]
MSILKEPGKRYIQVEIEVPGTPEEVWNAIATGNGWTAWFTRTEIEERDGGAVAHYMGGGKSPGVVTAWEPPHRFAAEAPNYVPGAPPLGTEVLVEARSGDTCVVRLVNSLFTDASDWDGQLDGVEGGWPAFLQVLRIYLSGFAGQHAAMAELAGMTEGPKGRAFTELKDALGLSDATVGSRVQSAAGSPPFTGILERADSHAVVLRMESPIQGAAVLGAHDCGGPVMTWMNLYAYGEGAEGVESAAAPLREWMAKRFPMPAPPAAPEVAASA